MSKYAYGYGMAGCLFDGCSGPYESHSDALEAAADFFEFTSLERDELNADSIVRFTGERRAELAIGDYLEIFEVDEDWTDGND